MDNQVSLYDYIEEMKNRLERFKKYWEDNNKIDPKIFPMSISNDDDGIWDEMFNTFE